MKKFKVFTLILLAFTAFAFLANNSLQARSKPRLRTILIHSKDLRAGDSPKELMYMKELKRNGKLQLCILIFQKKQLQRRLRHNPLKVRKFYVTYRVTKTERGSGGAKVYHCYALRAKRAK